MVYEKFSITYLSDFLARKSCHTHNADEVVMVTCGECIITCDGRVVHVAAPFIVYYPANMLHEQISLNKPAFERWCFRLSPEIIGSTAILPGTFFVLQLNDEQCEQFLTYIRILYHYWGREEYTDRYLPLHFEPVDLTRLKYLLLLFVNELRPLIPDTVPAKSTYINDVCLYISENPAKRFTLDSLAGHFFVGRATLTKDFRRKMGMSVVEFITTVRVNRAKFLLEDNLSLSEIAEQCGFSSVSYFIKVFTRCTGLSPVRWRSALEKLP